MNKLSELQTCTEAMPEGGRAIYSIFVLLFQFLLPMLTLCLAYYQVRHDGLFVFECDMGGQCYDFRIILPKILGEKEPV
jgi:hypothetical protein